MIVALQGFRDRWPRWAIVLIGTIAFMVLGLARAQAQGEVDPRSGQLLLTVTDLSLQVGPITLELERTLERRSGHQGVLGSRWRSNWESRAVSTPTAVIIEGTPYPIAFARESGKQEYHSVFGEQVVVQGDGRFVRTTTSGMIEIFDRQGRLAERDYRNGNKATVRYGADGRIARIDGPRASFIQFSADNQGRLARAEASTGSSVRYGYTGDNLTEVQVNGGPVVRYTYDTRGALARIDHPRSGAVDLAYDARQRVVSRRWADGAEERFEHDDGARAQRRIDPTGAVTVTRFDQDGRRAEVIDPRGGKIAIAFDANGRPESVTGPSGGTAKTVYDSLGRPAAFHDPYGQVTRYEYLGATARVKTIARPDGTQESVAYDPQQNVTELKVGAQTLAALAYHPDGTISAAKALGVPEQRLTYDGQARLQTLTNPLGERLQWSYDARGNPLRTVNPLGGVTAWQWDAQDRLVSETDPVGGITRYEYDSSGRLARVVDPLGGVTRFEYDVRGRLVAETDPSGQVTRYKYDRAGRLAELSRGATRESFRYDPVGNLIEWVDRLGRTVQIERDLLGRITQERASTGLQMQYRYDARGQLGAMEDPRAGKLELQRDERGQVIAMRDALGATTQFQYDAIGNVTGRRDTRGQLKQFGYTGESALARVQEPSGDAAEYRYDAASRLVEIVRPSGGRSRFSYNGLGNLTQEIDPLGHERRSQYDVAGRLVASTDATGRTTRYTYDAAGRLTEKHLPNEQRVTFKYDAISNLLEADDGAFPVRYQYDRAGRPVKVEYPAIKKAVGYEYNAEGLRTKLIGPDGRVTRYEYDGHKQLAAIIPPDGKRIALGYDAQQRLQSILYPNGVTGRWEYDAAGRVAKLAHVDGSGKPIDAWSYRYDGDGKLLQQYDAQGRSTNFSYDPAGQLTEAAAAAGVMRYRYARGGNRTASEEGGAVTQYRYDGGDRVLEAGPDKLSYDPNGNLIRRQGPRGATLYEYDAQDRLVRVQLADGRTTTFGYAPSGERVWQRNADGLTYYVYDGRDLIQELNENGNTKAAYTHGPGIDQPLAMLREGKSYYYQADRLGSIRALTDEGGKVAAAYDYDPFGKVEASRGSVANPFTFTGREWDTGTGLYYYRARYYDPGLGGFLSRDPYLGELFEPLTLHRYAYAGNDPVNFIDDTGLSRGRPSGSGKWVPPPAQPSKPAFWFDPPMRSVPSRVQAPPDGDDIDALIKWVNKAPKGSIQRAARTVTLIAHAANSLSGGTPESATFTSRLPKSIEPAVSGRSWRPQFGNRFSAALPGKGTIIGGLIFAGVSVFAGQAQASPDASARERVQIAGESLGEHGRGLLESGAIKVGCAAIGGAIGFCSPVPGGAAIGAAIGSQVADVGPLVVSLLDAVSNLLEPGRGANTGPYLPQEVSPGALAPGHPGFTASVDRTPPAITPTPEVLYVPQPPEGASSSQAPSDPSLGRRADALAGDTTRLEPTAVPPTAVPGGYVPQGDPSFKKPPARGGGGTRDPNVALAEQQQFNPVPGAVPPVIPKGGKKGVEQPKAYQAPPAIDVTQAPPVKPPSYVDTCPQTDQAGNVLAWVPCPPGVFPGTPLPPGQSSVWCRSASGESFAIPMYPCPPNSTPGPPPTAGAPQPGFTPPRSGRAISPSPGPPPRGGGTTGGGTPPSVPVVPPVVISQAPPVTPPTTPPVIVPVTPPPVPGAKTPPSTAKCSLPLCYQAGQANCEKGPLPNEADWIPACYANMLKRCNEGVAEEKAGRIGGWCVRPGADPSCEVRAQRVCAGK